MKAKISTILTDESAGVVEQRNVRDSKRKRSESSLSDVQLHQIKSTTLRTSANNFFGTSAHSNSSPMSSSDGSRTPHEVREIKTRSQLMQSLDPIIMSFNAADFETLAKSIRAICSRDVSLSCKLVADPITNDDGVDILFDIDEVVFPEPPPSVEPEEDPFQHHLTGVSALLLLWVLLHETHPDAVMQIIDRRICYRQILPLSVSLEKDKPISTTSTTEEPATSKHVVASSGRSSRSAHKPFVPAVKVETRPVVSIIEAVLKFSGSCITSHSLDALFTSLSQRSGILSPHPAVPTASGHSSATDATTSSTTSAPAVVGASTSSNSLKLNPNALAEYISDFLTHETGDLTLHVDAPHDYSVSTASVVPPATVSVPFVYTNSNTITAGTSSAGTNKKEVLASLRETSRQYLADVTLVFNEFDLVTRFEFNIRVAEEFTQTA